jgi:hypothetical protein
MSHHLHYIGDYGFQVNNFQMWTFTQLKERTSNYIFTYSSPSNSSSAIVLL